MGWANLISKLASFITRTLKPSPAQQTLFFTDLPPEIRNKVYKLFRFEVCNNNKESFPLLLVSRQILEEYQGFHFQGYTLNLSSIEFDLSTRPIQLKLAGDVKLQLDRFQFHDIWPPLQRAQRIHLNLSAWSGPKRAQTRKARRQFIFSFASAFSTSKSLESVEIQITIDHVYTTAWFRDPNSSAWFSIASHDTWHLQKLIEDLAPLAILRRTVRLEFPLLSGEDRDLLMHYVAPRGKLVG